ncbi:peptidoglycan recognition family protein [Pricia sp.]|uniref:peptidoglycan recognition protein family protein n=1 Tax=Pricia sp. TaxID=2268138 RepID=UPI003593B1CD
MKKFLLPILFLLLHLGCKSQVEIIDKPIIFDESRKELTLDYLEDHYGLQQDTPTIDPKMIVLHWTAIPTFEGSFDAFKDVKLPSWRPDLENASALNVSSHFLVDQDGTIYRLMPETIMARHVIGLNHAAIGVENVGGNEGKPLTEAQLKSNIALVEYLVHTYNIEYLIGHYEYTNFENHPLWLEKDDGYRTKKTDPGQDFMRKVRQATAKLNFKENP